MAEQSAARELAWKIYIAKVNELLSEQFSTWKDGLPSARIAMTAPSNEALNLIETALRAATDDGLHQSIVQLNRAIDDIDNSGKKSAETKHHREHLALIVAALRALQSTSLQVAK